MVDEAKRLDREHGGDVLIANGEQIVAICLLAAAGKV